MTPDRHLWLLVVLLLSWTLWSVGLEAFLVIAAFGGAGGLAGAMASAGRHRAMQRKAEWDAALHELRLLTASAPREADPPDA